MGTTSEKLTYLNTTKTFIKEELNLGGANITNEPFREYKSKLEGIYKDFLANGTDTLWNNWEKVTGSGTEISLNNTIEAKMKVDLKGNTKQSILPSGYTQVEYIESTGTQYIDTGFSPNQDTRILVDALFYDTNTTVRTLFSSVESNWGRSMFTLYSYGYKIQIAYGNSFSAESVSKVQTRAIYDMNKNVLYINGEEKYSLASSTFTNTKSILLLARKANDVLDAYATAKIYSCKIYDNNVLVRNMIPCYRNSDNAVGLYDLVGNQFYTNSGTGTFTKGNNTPTPDTPIDIQVVSGDNSIKVEGKNLIDVIIENNTSSSVNREITVSTPLKAGTYTVRFIGKVIGEQSSCGLMSGSTYIAPLNWYNLSKTFTLTEDTTITKVYADVPANRTFYVQLEKGSTASETYTPYQSASYPISLGDKELCKIGTYQDKIFKNKLNTTDYNSDLKDNTWYLKKEIGKVVLDGSESWNFDSTKTITQVFQKGEAITDKKTNINNFYSNYFIYQTGDTEKLTFGNINNGSIYIAINKTTASTVNDFKNWLSTHNTDVYYVLATPTYEEITDTTLISQLEAIKSLNEQTNISQENNDLPFELDVVALKKLESI